ncbi:MAG: regulator of chromosome condensation [Ilumatobacteraceae bacterium]|nr:regulator of chromosome condensation [Ilumatobacteraceae bacterium]
MLALLSGVLSLITVAATPQPAAAAEATSLSAIAAGSQHSCGVTASGAAVCWGANYVGQLGTGTTSSTPTTAPSQVKGLTSGVTAISVGGSTSCAVVSGAAWCWGWNANGELGTTGVGSSSTVPVQVPGLTSGVTAISSGENHSCAVASGVAWCWGFNNYGALGNNTTSGATPPVVASGLTSGVTAISAGTSHSCAVVFGAAKCWGLNGSGQLGTDSVPSYSPVPVQVTGLTSGVAAISAGDAHSCAVVLFGAKCWGSNANGQLGNGATGAAPVLAPVPVSGLATGVTAISAGEGHSCAVAAGAVDCWGSNGSGRLGNDSLTASSVPVAVPGLTAGASAISAGHARTCAVVSGVASCWGSEIGGGNGNYTATKSSVPLPVWGLTSGVTSMAAAATSSCAAVSGAAKCWGSDAFMGNGAVAGAADSPMAVPVSALGTGVTAVASGPDHSCAVVSGAAKCWGKGGDGQLGNNGFSDSTVPVQVSSLTSGVTAISVGAKHSCAIVTGFPVCWGSNASGQLGNGSSTSSSVPVDVLGLSYPVTAISAGTSHSCAVASGAAKCWGAGGYLGNGSFSGSSLPVPVTGLSSGVTSIVAGQYHSCAVASGAAKCWGINTWGNLGVGQGISQTTAPFQVTGLTSGVSSVSVGPKHSCAVVSGAAMCWGSNDFGQLGNPTSQAWVPVPVEGLTEDVTAVSGGTSHTCAVVAGAGQCWGSGARGQLGVTTGVPVAVPGGQVFASAPNAAPLALGASHELQRGAANAITFNLAAVDAEGDPFDGSVTGTGFTVVGGGGPGPLSCTKAGVCTFSASSAAQPGAYTFLWTVKDPTSSSAAMTETLVVKNTAPTVVPLTVNDVQRGRPAADEAFTLPGFDTNGDPLSYTVVTRPSVGTLTCSSAGSCTYTVPANTAAGNRTFTYRASDGNDTSTTETVTLGIANTAPVANNVGPLHVTVGSGRSVTLSGSDFNGDTLTYAAPATAPSKGTVSGTGAARSYVPLVNTKGDDSFTYTVSDNGPSTSAPGVVSMIIDNTAPVATAASVVAPRGVATPFSLAGTDANADPLTYAVQTFPTKGDLVCTPDGACAYTARAGQSGTDSFTFVANDGTANSTAKTVTISITNQAPVAASQAVAAKAHVATPIKVTATDPNGDPVTYAVATLPGKGGVTCASSGSCTYTSTGNSLGADSFTFRATDSSGVSSTATVTITLSADAPTIIGGRTPAANANGWNNEPVTVSFTCGSENLASCTPPVVVSTDGAGQSVTGKATDNYGQSTSATVPGISIDRVAPTLVGLASTPPNAAGWYRAPVSMTWTCNDARSGISEGVCPTASTTVGEGPAVSVSASVHDKAGNQASATSQAVRIDMTRPSTGVASPPTWSNTDVSLTLAASDAMSGVAKTEYSVDDGPVQTGIHPVVRGQGHHTVSYWSTDAAGNEETHASIGVNIDVDAPSITAHVAPAPNRAGWHKGDVEVTFTCGDADSGVATCTGDRSFTDEADTVVTGTARDRAGNTASDQATVRIDRTAPTVTAQVPPANTHGWFNEAVQVPFACSDTGGSGVDACPAPLVIGGEGVDQPVVGTAADAAGNEASSSGASVSVDLTAPTISGAAVNGSNGNGGHFGNVTIRWICADELSGVVACPADVVVSGEGSHTISASVADRAGNTTSAEVTIRIDHDPSTDPGIVHGLVSTSGSGSPIAGASVTLRTTAGAIVASTTTGTDGVYTFPTVADGSYKLYVAKSGFIGAYWPSKADVSAATAFTVAHGTNLTRDQALASTPVLSGTVRTSDGVPISGATVRVGPSALAAVTDASGAYRFTGLLPGSVTVSVTAYLMVPSSTSSFVLSGDRVHDVTMVAAGPGTGVKGTITNRVTGVPKAGATVRVWPKGSSTMAMMVTTGANGRFSVASLPVGTYEFDVIGDFQVRWFGDVLSRSSAVPVPITTGCAASADAAWGDPCAATVDIHIG